MKKAKKKIIIALCTVVALVAVVVTTVFSTVAYLTSSAAVLNAFTIGNVQMTMFESKVNNDGTKVDPLSTVKNADTNSYHLVCDKTYIKDPTIYIQPNSEASYLFIIARNDIRGIEDPHHLSMREQLMANGWKYYGEAATGKVYVYTGVTDDAAVLSAKSTYDAAVAGVTDAAAIETARAAREATIEAICKNSLATGVSSDDEVVSVDLFEEFSVAANADLSKYGAAEVKVTAVAIQTTGFGTTVGDTVALQEAWTAVIETYPYIYDGSRD